MPELSLHDQIHALDLFVPYWAIRRLDNTVGKNQNNQEPRYESSLANALGAHITHIFPTKRHYMCKFNAYTRPTIAEPDGSRPAGASIDSYEANVSAREEGSLL